MAQPLLARLRARRPDAAIDVLAPPWVAPVLRRMPEVDEVIEADLRHGRLQLGARWRLARRLKARGYAAAYVLPNSLKSALVPFLAGIPERIGYLGERRYGLVNRRVAAPSAAARGGAGNGHEPMPVHYARLAGEAGAAPLPAPRLETPPNDTAARFGIEAPYVVLCPGAEYGPAKRWPYFAELSSAIQGTVVVLGSASDAQAAAGLRGVNLVGRTSLAEAIDLIAGARAVVSNDSGLMHVAAATGTPQVALFGSSSPEHTPPQSPAARVLWLRVECSPCYRRECPLGHFRCLRELHADRVLAELRSLA